MVSYKIRMVNQNKIFSFEIKRQAKKKKKRLSERCRKDSSVWVKALVTYLLDKYAYGISM